MSVETFAYVDEGLLKSIGGFTWPGIEYGEAPSFKYSFFEYIDAIRFGDLDTFTMIEEESGDWWFPTLDRGAGAALHFAAEHGQLECARFLVEQRGVRVNQRDVSRGWTPLHRCANMAHHTHAPFLATFEYLLRRGADAATLTELSGAPKQAKAMTAVEVAVQTGQGWEPGQLQARLQALVDLYADVPKEPVYTYEGGPIGERAAQILEAWQQQAPVLPPENWRPPPPAGFLAAQGMRRVEDEPWRPVRGVPIKGSLAGEDDGSCFIRPMTEAELRLQSENVAAVH